MSLLLVDYIETAVNSLKNNRSRTVLTTLGIAIGIASVTTILALAHGVTESVSNQVKAVGGNVAIVRPGVETPSNENALTNPVSPQHYNTSTISETDVDIIGAIDKRLNVAPIMTIDGRLTAGDTVLKNASIVATTPELPSTTSLPVDEGQFIDDTTSGRTAVVGYQMAIDLFGTENPISSNFQLRGETFTVIGVLKKINQPVNYNNIDFDKSVIIALESGKQFHEGRSQIQQINISAPSSSLLNKSLTKVKSELINQHGEKDFTIVSGKDIAKPTNQLFQTMTTIMTVIAAISIVVGGIGIMNIMLVNVAERTREIGIRKAVGASNKNIIMQFLTESIIISLIGGVIGAVSGVIIAYFIGSALYFMPVLSWNIALVALGMSVAAGVIFGLYPAARAAAKDPIDSLRQYR